MNNDLLISNLTLADIKSAYLVFELSIPDTFEKEGLSHLSEDIKKEIAHKKSMLEESLQPSETDLIFLKAKVGDTVVGVISFGPCGNDFKKCTESKLHSIGELGSLYVLPDFQDKGIGSALIGALVTYLSHQQIDQFCLDSGYKRAQKRWVRKFGVPYKEVKDYWGPDSVHMIWVCNVNDFRENGDEHYTIGTETKKELRN